MGIPVWKQLHIAKDISASSLIKSLIDHIREDTTGRVVLSNKERQTKLGAVEVNGDPIADSVFLIAQCVQLSSVAEVSAFTVTGVENVIEPSSESSKRIGTVVNGTAEITDAAITANNNMFK